MKPVGKLREFMSGTELAPAGVGSPRSGTRFYVYRHCRAGGSQTTGASAESDRKTCIGLLLVPESVPGQRVDTLPQCFVYRANSSMERLLNQFVQTDPDTVFMSDNNTIQQQLWQIDEHEALHSLQNLLDQLPAIYPLQHWVCQKQEVAAATSLLLICDEQVKPLPCHRLLADLAGMDDYEFLQRLQKCFNIRVASGPADAEPCSAREFGLFVAGCWYKLSLIAGTWFHADPVSDLDVSVVHDNMIAPMLGITDVEDPRIAYTDTNCSLSTLQQQVESGKWQAAWLMPAPTIDDMMRITDLGRLMPAHSVCFKPVILPSL